MPAVTTITDPSGFDWILDGTLGMWEAQGKKGFHAPTYIHYRDESPAIAGGFFRGSRAIPRELFLPVVIRDQNRDNVLARRRELIRAIAPHKGECVIKSAWPDGSPRSIRCRYIDGIDAGEQGAGEWGITVLKYGLRFIADDPYTFGDQLDEQWDFTAATRLELPMPGADTFYEVVTSPLLSDGSLITNTGDVDAYPSWTFIGPFTQVTLGNSTTGKSFTMLYTAATNANKLFVVTAPGETSIVDENGVNRWDTLTAGYSLWPLIQGDNVIDVALVGAGTGTSALMSYRPQYEAD